MKKDLLTKPYIELVQEDLNILDIPTLAKRLEILEDISDSLKIEIKMKKILRKKIKEEIICFQDLIKKASKKKL